MVNNTLPLSLFNGFGIEIEYMIVKLHNLDIAPIADILLLEEASNNDICYSNELALHLIELKTNGPKQNLAELPTIFNEHIRQLNQQLASQNACLLPSGAHPWMIPQQELKIWPHDYSDIYNIYNAIFNCATHGWCNVQSTHLNLPFANDEEFKKLHSAIRIILPIIPALAASSPIIELKSSGYKDSRLFYYNQNQSKIPIIAGSIIPEFITSKQQYEQQILHEIYRAISPFDPQNVLQHEWLNSRGAIARFDRNSIEIRLLDTQESPLADLAIIALIVGTLQNLVAENWSSYLSQTKLSTKKLHAIYLNAIKYGSDSEITDSKYLKAFGVNSNKIKAIDLWREIFEKIQESKYAISQDFITPLETILTHGNLAERILKKLPNDFTKQQVRNIYQELHECLINNMLFT